MQYVKPNIELFESREKNIRDEMKHLFVELCKKFGTKSTSELRVLLKEIMKDNKKIEALIQEIENLSKPPANLSPVQASSAVLPPTPTLESIQPVSMTASMIARSLSAAPVSPVASIASGAQLQNVSSPLQPTSPMVDILDSLVKPNLSEAISTDSTDSKSSSNNVINEKKIELKKPPSKNLDTKEIDDLVAECIIKDGKFLSG